MIFNLYAIAHWCANNIRSHDTAMDQPSSWMVHRCATQFCIISRAIGGLKPISAVWSMVLPMFKKQMGCLDYFSALSSVPLRWTKVENHSSSDLKGWNWTTQCFTWIYEDSLGGHNSLSKLVHNIQSDNFLQFTDLWLSYQLIISPFGFTESPALGFNKTFLAISLKHCATDGAALST